MKTQRYTSLKYFLSLILLGSNGVISSFISLSSYKIVLLRTLLGASLLFFLFFLGKNSLTFYKHPKDLFYVVTSGIANGLSWIFLFEAYDKIGVSISALLYSCGPIIVIILSLLVYKEKLKKAALLGFSSILIGIYLINGGIGGISHSISGIIYGILSAVMYAVMVMFNRKSKKITGIENSMLQLIVGFVLVTLILVIRQDLSIEITSSNILPILILGLVNTGIGCYMFFSAVATLPVQTVAIGGYLEPLSAVMFSVLILNESMNFIQLIGIVLLLIGLIVCQLNQSTEVRR